MGQHIKHSDDTGGGWNTGRVGGIEDLRGYARLQAEDERTSARLTEQCLREAPGPRWAAKVIVQCSAPGCLRRATGRGMCDKHRAYSDRLLRTRPLCVTTDSE